MTKRPRVRCIFCRGSPLTLEHILPDWMREIIPRTPDQKHNFITATKNPDVSQERIETSDLRQGHPLSKKVRVVCKSCNTGWLSDFEDELKPKIKPLILGGKSILTPWDQRRVATWAAKTSMTMEFIHPETAAITFGEREYLRLHREPKKTFNVWIGRYKGIRHKFAYHHHSLLFESGSPTPTETMVPPNTQATVIRAGGLFLHVTSSSAPGVTFDLKNETPGSRGDELRRIWPSPSGDLNWLAAPALSDSDINNFLALLEAAFTSKL